MRATLGLAILALVALVVLLAPTFIEAQQQTAGTVGALISKDADPVSELQVAAANRVAFGAANPRLTTTGARPWAVPNLVSRFLFYNAKSANDKLQAQLNAGLNDYKRSSSPLDALSGVTFGKRSAPPAEFVNLEPVFGRQYPMRGGPRMYDLRWAPLDYFDNDGAQPSSVNAAASDNN